MADKLSTYNLALLLLGERRIASLTEQREPRRVLDDFWALVPTYCLAQGMWWFAMRVAQLNQVAGGNGFEHGYTKPPDIIHLAVMSDQAGLFPQIVSDYLDVTPTIFTHSSALYVRYTSNDPNAGGMNLAAWTDAFNHYVAATLARMAAPRITGSWARVEELSDQEDAAYLTAFSIDSTSDWRGLLPFNASAREGSAVEPYDNPLLMPFGAYRRAVARLSRYGRAPVAAQ